MWYCIELELGSDLHRSEFLYRERFNLSAAERHLVAEDPGAPAAVVPPGGPFALAWRNYMKSVLKKGFMYKFSCRPSAIIYVAENKTLAGKEDRTYEGEATGRKLAIVFFEDAGGGLVRRVDRETLAMKQHLLTLAELLQTIGGFVAVPPDPERTSANTELLLESRYQDLDIQRFTCTLEPQADEVHRYSLDNEDNAEAAFAIELLADHRTKMVLARCIQRHGEFQAEETLQSVWNLSVAQLRARSVHLFPAPPVPLAPAAPGVPPAPAPAAPPVPAAPAAGRGRARGRGAHAAVPVPAAARGRGRGRAAAPPAALPRGRGRGRG